MRVQPECIACFVRQAVDAAKLATDDPAIHWQVAIKAARLAADTSPEVTPVFVAMPIHALVRRLAGSRDPYAQMRRELNERAMALWPRLHRLLADAEDWVEMGVRIAIAGNIMDLGVVSPEALADAEAELNRALAQDFAISDLPRLRDDIEQARTVLYIGDNAGEIVFDKAFIAQMAQRGKQVTFAVRGAPIINDVVLADAQQVGMADVARVVETGFEGPGAELQLCSDEFRRLFDSADVVIAKGQGNFESLSGMDGLVYLLLQAKCPAIARHIGVPVRSLLCMLARHAPA